MYRKYHVPTPFLHRDNDHQRWLATIPLGAPIVNNCMYFAHWEAHSTGHGPLVVEAWLIVSLLISMLGIATIVMRGQAWCLFQRARRRDNVL